MGKLCMEDLPFLGVIVGDFLESLRNARGVVETLQNFVHSMHTAPSSTQTFWHLIYADHLFWERWMIIMSMAKIEERKGNLQSARSTSGIYDITTWDNVSVISETCQQRRLRNYTWIRLPCVGLIVNQWESWDHTLIMPIYEQLCHKDFDFFWHGDVSRHVYLENGEGCGDSSWVLGGGWGS